MSVSIRAAVPADADRITHYNRCLAEESEGKSLDGETVLAGVSRVLRESGQGQYFVAESGAEVVGQLLITFEWSDWRNGQFWWIQSVYVAPDHRRQGVFTALFRHVSELARAAPNVCGIRLYVEEYNASALATYDALGLQNAGYRVLEMEFD